MPDVMDINIKFSIRPTLFLTLTWHIVLGDKLLLGYQLLFYCFLRFRKNCNSLTFALTYILHFDQTFKLEYNNKLLCEFPLD